MKENEKKEILETSEMERFAVTVSRLLAIGVDVHLCPSGVVLCATPDWGNHSALRDTLLENLEACEDGAREFLKLPPIDRKPVETLPTFVPGPDAACSCGSTKPLAVRRTIDIEFPWDQMESLSLMSRGLDEPTGNEIHGNENFDALAWPIPGEVLTCPDCGNRYQVA